MTIVNYSRVEGDDVVIDVDYHTKPVPEEVSAIIGDVVHNLRSSLDHLASELAAAKGGNPDKVYFPFAEKEGDLDLMIRRKNFAQCGRAAVDLLKSLKPYTGGNLELRALHEMDLIDKHRGLIPRPHMTAKTWPRLLTHPDGSQVVDLGVSDTPPVILVMPPETGLKGRPLVKTLKELVQLCEGIVEAFAALEPPPEKRG